MNTPDRPLVVNLGLPKSGTTTLARALREAGWTVADYRIRRRDTEDKALHGRYVGGLMYHGYFEEGDPLARLGGFNAFTEINRLTTNFSYWPQTDWGLISAIRTRHPGTRFLASRRDAAAHAESMFRWADLGSTRLPRYTVPGLPRGFGLKAQERIRWIEAHHAFLAHVFSGAEDFLEYDIADAGAPAKIGAFLGHELPWWGRANANPRSPAANPGEVSA